MGILFGDMIAANASTRLSWKDKLLVLARIIETCNSVSLENLSADHFIWMWHLTVRRFRTQPLCRLTIRSNGRLLSLPHAR